MRKILLFLLLTSLLFPVGGVVIFNDGTTVEGDINGVNANSVYITPIGLSFPEEILMDNVDSLRLYDGKLLIANSQVLLLYSNGQFMTPEEEKLNRQTAREEYDVEYVIIPNWSLNFYTGYPIYRASSFEEFDHSNIIYGFSIGSPWGIFLGDFFMNAIGEIAYYNFQQKNDMDGPSFGGPAFQIGLSPGLFIGQMSISLTTCTGVYKDDLGDFTAGFIGGGSIDLPLGNLIVDKYGDVEIVDDLEEVIEAIEIRLTGRANLIQKNIGATGWFGGGISLGYEF